MNYYFPFGESLKAVEQKDRSPKDIFVLGVYASAVHAKWKGIDGKIKVRALAVASEPYIFWRGDNCSEIISQISIPKEIGSLEPASENLNGPSGKVLDDLFLKPLGASRKQAWLCDLLPYSRINENQSEAIEEHYNPLIKKHNLPECTVPHFSKTELGKQQNRHVEILNEIEESQCKTIVLLGDLPIKYWLAKFSNFARLSDFGKTVEKYGKPHEMKFGNRKYNVIPLVHPRQAGRLGAASKDWNQIHQKWVAQMCSS